MEEEQEKEKILFKPPKRGLWRAPGLSLPSLITCVPPQTRGTEKAGTGPGESYMEAGGYLGPRGDLTHLMSNQQMRTDAEDGDFDVVFQLQRKEMLQQLLILLSSGVVLKTQPDMGSHQDKQPKEPPKER